MVPDMLLLRADEVARNGAFGKILRPEVFPDAPLQLRLSPKYTPLSFLALPQKVLPKMRISREMGGVSFEHPSPRNFRQKLSGQNKLIPHIDAGLSQQLGDRVAL
jgi:hypothetical protein